MLLADVDLAVGIDLLLSSYDARGEFAADAWHLPQLVCRGGEYRFSGCEPFS